MTILSSVLVSQLAPAIVWVINQMMLGINKVRSAGTFWGDFSVRAQTQDFWGRFKDFFAPKREGTEDFAGLWKDVSKAFTQSGATSEAALEQMNDASEAMMANLLKKQKEIEDANRNPDFESVMGVGRDKKSREGYSDSLLAVGNFLGGGKNAMQAVAEQQLDVLRQIAANTLVSREVSPGHVSTSFEGIPPH